MGILTEFAETAARYASSARAGFYLLVICAVIMTALTVAWCASLLIEVTRKRASKLSIKYGSAGEKEKEIRGNIVKITLWGILIAIAWVVFIILL